MARARAELEQAVKTHEVAELAAREYVEGLYPLEEVAARNKCRSRRANSRWPRPA